MHLKDVKSFRVQLSEKIMELGNLAFAGFAINQVILGGESSLYLSIIGATLAMVLYIFSYLLYD